MYAYFLILCLFINIFKFCLSESFNSKDCKCRINLSPKIVGGEESHPNSIPWQISLSKYNKHICGGTIINRKWIMTAAHCVSSTIPKLLNVRVGIHDLRKIKSSNVYNVSKIVVHSQYLVNSRETSDPGDIALLKLSKHLTFNKTVQPACLSTDFEDYDNEIGSLLASGWGSITTTIQSEGYTSNSKLSNVLKQANFNYINPKSNNLKAVLGIKPQSVSSNCAWKHLICIQPEIKEDSVCNGDSGGPLHYTKNSVSLVVGIASFVLGYRDYSNKIVFCKGEGAYARISSYISFINNHVGKNKYCK